MVLSHKQVCRKAKFPLFFSAVQKNTFPPFSKICFWSHPQTVNLGTFRLGSFVAPVKTYTMAKKRSEKIQSFPRNRGKRFFFGGNFPLNGGKAVKKKGFVVYGNKSTACHWLKNDNFRRKFSYVSRFCALLMTSLILGEVRGTKNRIVFVEFQSECYVKISSTKNDV